jgi:hypothetical protein
MQEQRWNFCVAPLLDTHLFRIGKNVHWATTSTLVDALSARTSGFGLAWIFDQRRPSGPGFGLMPDM